MKKIIYVILFVLSLSIYSCNDNEDYSLHRPDIPEKLFATKGDTSVFLSWTPVSNASYYILVRGLDVIADSLMSTEYEDSKAPDTLTEYRVYAVNDRGWRSRGYAADSGYLGIPKGILPRAPQTLSVSMDNYQGCMLKWTNGRFANSYSIYKDGKYLATTTDNSFMDYTASTGGNKYEVYSLNDNGKSSSPKTAEGAKAYVFQDTYETYSTGNVIKPWTFVADRIAYYTEGTPTVTADNVYRGSKALQLKSSKVQLLFDWGGVFVEGFYEVSFWAYKKGGTFTFGPNFSDWEDKPGEGKWVHYAVRTGLLKKGQSFNMTLVSDDNPLYIDDLSIEYISPSAIE